jgi:hypothetical protein
MTTQQNDIQHNDIQHNNTQHEDIQHNHTCFLTLRRRAIWHNDTQHNGPNPATKLNIVFTVMPSAVMLSVRMGSVMTPRQVF